VWLALAVSGLLTKDTALQCLLIEAPIFFGGIYVSSVPYRRRLVSMRHAVVWTVVVPFLIWAALVTLPFALLLLLDTIVPGSL